MQKHSVERLKMMESGVATILQMVLNSYLL